MHAVVARSTFPSQNAQGAPFSEHFWKLRCRKSAGRCGAKHMSKSKCEKHFMFGPLLDVQMLFRVAGRFSESTFRPSGTTNHWKNAVNRDFPTFSRTCILFLFLSLFLFFDLLSSALLFSDSSHLCFSISPYCRKFGF